MGAIEAITAETRVVKIGVGTAERDVEVGVWNKTVSNLSLMALGSSAPEILLAIIEVRFSRALGCLTVHFVSSTLR